MYRVGSYSGCASCGSTKTIKTVTALLDDGSKELLVVKCAGCGTNRAKYKRKRKAIR